MIYFKYELKLVYIFCSQKWSFLEGVSLDNFRSRKDLTIGIGDTHSKNPFQLTIPKNPVIYSFGMGSAHNEEDYMRKNSITIKPGIRYSHLVTTGKYIPGYSDGIKIIRALAECICDCGSVINVDFHSMKRGHKKVCSLKCILHNSKRNLKHGVFSPNSGKGVKEYAAWAQMKQRCNNPKHPSYHLCGARGITVCKDWQSSFLKFFDHVGKAPSSKHRLTRLDKKGDYHLGNVHWVLPGEKQEAK